MYDETCLPPIEDRDLIDVVAAVEQEQSWPHARYGAKRREAGGQRMLKS